MIDDTYLAALSRAENAEKIVLLLLKSRRLHRLAEQYHFDGKANDYAFVAEIAGAADAALEELLLPLERQSQERAEVAEVALADATRERDELRVTLATQFSASLTQVSDALAAESDRRQFAALCAERDAQRKELDVRWRALLEAQAQRNAARHEVEALRGQVERLSIVAKAAKAWAVARQRNLDLQEQQPNHNQMSIELARSFRLEGEAKSKLLDVLAAFALAALEVGEKGETKGKGKTG